MRLHFHYDPDWRVLGANAYFQCKRCGARKVRTAYRTLAGPVLPGWPALVDGHGMPRIDTGWHKPPPGGWRHNLPDSLIPVRSR